MGERKSVSAGLRRDGVVVVVSGFGHTAETGGGLFVFDGGEIHEIDRTDTTGLGVGDGHIARLLRSTADDEAIAEMLVYDTLGVRSYRRLDGLSDPHDVQRVPGGWIVVSSSENTLEFVGDDGSRSTHWRPSAVTDSWHPNCVTWHAGHTWVTAFGRFESTAAWSGDAARGSGFLRDLTDGVELGGLSHPHSPRRVDGTWWVCNSLDGRLVRRAGDAWETVVRLEQYPRGLAIHGDTAFVGESSHRRTPGRTAALAIVRDGEVIARLQLPCDEVYDVAVLPTSAVHGLRRGFRTGAARSGPRRSGVQDIGDPRVVDGLGDVHHHLTADTQVDTGPPTRMLCRQSFRLSVRVTNTCEATLASAAPSPIFLSYRWHQSDDDGGAATPIDGARVPLGQLVLPGETVTRPLDLIAPDHAGTYELTVGLVHEGVRWLEGDERPVATVCVELQPPTV
jgi:acetolactate synthase-1/2/3 large subunit